MDLKIAPAAIAFLVVACGDAATRSSDVVVRDSAGIVIVENRPPDSTAVAWWQIDNAPELDIGGANAPETHALYDVTDATRLADGRIVVANSGTHDIRYYSADGEHLRTSGRRGGGPGEFQRIASILSLPGDSLLVNDPAARRASILDPQGAFVRSIATAGTAYPTISGGFTDGSFGGTFSIFAGAGAGGFENGLQRPDVAFVRVASEGTMLDTIAVVPGTERLFHVTMSGGSIASIEISGIPFGKSTTHAVRDDRLYIGTQDAPEIVAYDTVGNLTHIIRTGVPLVSVTDERVDAHIAKVTADLEPDAKQRVGDRLRSTPIGRFLPAYGVIMVDAAGNLWVADADDPIAPPGYWSVFDSDGRLLARVRLPEGFTVYEIGDDYVLGLERDDLDTEHIRLYRLLKDTN